MKIVIKIGTGTLAHPSGHLNIRRVEEICKVIADIKNAGHEIIPVSSGAILFPSHRHPIISCSDEAIAAFTARVDSTAVYVNASTRFTDGGGFGLGCEMGISTQKLHVRGPWV